MRNNATKSSNSDRVKDGLGLDLNNSINPISEECFTRDFRDADFRDFDADFRDFDADFRDTDFRDFDADFRDTDFRDFDADFRDTDFRDFDADFRDAPTDLQPFPTIHSQSAESKHSCFRLEEQFVIYLYCKKNQRKVIAAAE